MDSFFKKRPSSQKPKEGSQKRARLGTQSPQPSNLPDTPSVIVAWNCNGLTSRLRGGDSKLVKAFVAEHKPDVIFLSEVRVCAASNSVSRKPGPHAKWIRSQMRASDKKTMADAGLVRSFLFSAEMKRYKSYLSLANTKYAGTAMLVNTEAVQLPRRVRYNLGLEGAEGGVHDAEGRVIVAEFGKLSILHTYSPNNGWEEKHFQRRREWDERMRKYMEKMKEHGAPMMWVGDLNVAPTDADLSHPKYYRRQKHSWIDQRETLSVNPNPEDVGQPGCTDGERKRFKKILVAGDLVDAYREHVGDTHNQGLTWRGSVPGKHAGKGMRIDHCVVSRSALTLVESILITGHGTNRAGFLGSDHCPLLIRYKAKSLPANDEIVEAHDESNGVDLPDVNFSPCQNEDATAEGFADSV